VPREHPLIAWITIVGRLAFSLFITAGVVAGLGLNNNEEGHALQGEEGHALQGASKSEAAHSLHLSLTRVLIAKLFFELALEIFACSDDIDEHFFK
jgi:hypothetical protein